MSTLDPVENCVRRIAPPTVTVTSISYLLNGASRPVGVSIWNTSTYPPAETQRLPIPVVATCCPLATSIKRIPRLDVRGWLANTTAFNGTSAAPSAGEICGSSPTHEHASAVSRRAASHATITTTIAHTRITTSP